VTLLAFQSVPREEYQINLADLALHAEEKPPHRTPSTYWAKKSSTLLRVPMFAVTKSKMAPSTTSIAARVNNIPGNLFSRLALPEAGSRLVEPRSAAQAAGQSLRG